MQPHAGMDAEVGEDILYLGILLRSVGWIYAAMLHRTARHLAPA